MVKKLYYFKSDKGIINCHINQSEASVQYLTDILRQREEYEVMYHFHSSSLSGIFVY